MSSAQQETWQLQEAKNKLSQLVRKAQGGPQIITVQGKPQAVVVSFDEYRALVPHKKSLAEVMRSAPGGFGELHIERSRDADLREILL